MIDDWYENLKLSKAEKNEGTYQIRIEGLPQGQYRFAFKNGNKKQVMDISVVKGSIWEDSAKFILE